MADDDERPTPPQRPSALRIPRPNAPWMASDELANAPEPGTNPGTLVTAAYVKRKLKKVVAGVAGTGAGAGLLGFLMTLYFDHRANSADRTASDRQAKAEQRLSDYLELEAAHRAEILRRMERLERRPLDGRRLKEDEQ